MSKIKNVAIPLLLLMLSQQAFASDPFWDRASNQEHISSGYAMFLTSNYIYKNKLELSKESSLLLSLGTTFAFSILRDKFLFKTDSELFPDHMKATAFGAAIGTIFCVTFEF